LCSDFIFGFGLIVIPLVEVEVKASERAGALNPIPSDDLKTKLLNILYLKPSFGDPEPAAFSESSLTSSLPTHLSFFHRVKEVLYNQ